jgi:hypothetical protein
MSGPAQEKFYEIIRTLFADKPELAADCEKLFLREASPYKTSALFDYLFVVGPRPAFETEYFVGWRLRSPEERDAALGTLPVKSDDIHSSAPIYGSVRQQRAPTSFAVSERRVVTRSFEHLDDRVRRAAQLAEQGNNWLRPEKGSFVEQYRNFHLHIVARRIDVRPSYEGVLFKAGPREGTLKSLFSDRLLHAELSNEHFHSHQPFVFAKNIELMEGIEKVIPSTVRLCCFDDRQIGGTEPLFAFSHQVGAHKIGGSLSKGKVTTRAWSFSVPDSQCRSEQIKTGSEAVDAGPNGCIKCGRQIANDPKAQEFLAHCRIILGHDFIRGESSPGFDFVLDEWELGIGPVDGTVRVL